jgi:4-amino-4-deoxy-L-arabinose transferase-like glycosyltransferase
VLIFFFPWSVFLGPAIVLTIQRLQKKVPGIISDGYLLASCWFGVWFVFWSICKTKLPHYLLPAYPALALLTACWIDRWLAEPASVGRHWLRNAWISTIVVGVAITIAVPIVAAYVLPGEGFLGLVGLILVFGGTACWRATAANQHRRAAISFAAMSVVFLTAIFGFAALPVDRHQNAKPMIAAIRADWEERGGRSNLPEGETAPRIATYRFFRESTVFYAGQPVTRCDGGERSAQQQLADFLVVSTGFLMPEPPRYVITNNEYLPELEKAFPGRFRVILHQPRFLQPEPAEMFVLKF